MKIFIDGNEVSGDIVGPPAMNYGQLWRYEGRPQCRYLYRLGIDEFIRLASPWFEEFSHDDEVRNCAVEDNEGFPQLEEYRQLGFPTLQQMLQSYPVLLGKLMKFNELDLLNSVSGDDVENDVHYSANSLDTFVIHPDSVEFGGIAYACSK